MKKFYILTLAVLCSLSSWSQEFRRMIAVGTYSVQEIQAEAEAYFNEVGRGRGTGYNPYKRWEYWATRQADENGMLRSPQFYYEELERYNAYINENINPEARTTTGAWEEMGPTDWNGTSGWNPGVGRITSIAIDASDTNHIIVGGETGGVWKTTDAGNNWTVLTDNLSTMNVYALAMDPTNTQTYFWGTTNGTIFKSTDSGATWNILGAAGGGTVNKILVDPNNTQKMYASVQGSGVYKSTNGGTTWSKINGNSNTGYDVEFKPDNTNIIYASGTRFFRSGDGGATFTESVSAFGNGPKMIGVSADDPSVVYVLESTNGHFSGFYKSTTQGLIFTELNHTGKNYLGYSSDPNDPNDATSGQAPRDMDIVVNPENVDEVHIAGINTWMSTSGGTTFSITSQWTPGGAQNQNIGYCHADVDILQYVDGKLYVGSDGGVFKAENPILVSSDYYTDLTQGIGVRQFYKFGVSQTVPAVATGGSQDNGTSIMNENGEWSDWLGADGMETFIDKNDDKIVYGTIYNGILYKSLNSGQSLASINSPQTDGNWVTPFEQDPIEQDVIYAAYDELYKSEDGGQNWISISNSFGENIDNLKIAPSNNDHIYMSINGTFIASIDGGNNYFQSPFTTSFITEIAVHPTEPNRVAITTTDSERIYVSTNSGITFTSYKFDLPNFSASGIAWDNNSDHGLYIGMNYGVYYIDDTSNNQWLPFSNGLPNVFVSEMEINYAEGKLYASTYGRGLWRTDLFNPLSVNDFQLNEISMYPNTASNEFFLSWTKSDEVSVRVYNTEGKLMHYSKKVQINQPYRVDVANYASGLYFVKINNNKGEVTKKLIVE